jgi:guanylate kinase
MKAKPVPHPVIFLVSAPSGAGKTTLCQRLLQEEKNLCYSVSVTTRSPREGEVNGEHYEFIDRDTFLERVQQGDFLEHAEVHGNLYGTSWKQIENALSSGCSVLMDVDVQGARLIREALQKTEPGRKMAPLFHDVFISPPDLDVLRDRLEGRAQDAQEIIECRLQNAVEEMSEAFRYEFQVVNDDLESAYDQLRCVYCACCHHTLI